MHRKSNANDSLIALFALQLPKPVSEWQTRQNINKTRSGLMRMQNQVRILEQRKKKKIRGIQIFLENHRKHINARIDNQNHREDVPLPINKINRKLESEGKSACSSSADFRSLRKSRLESLSGSRMSLLKTNIERFSMQRKAQGEFHLTIASERRKALQEKVEARNRIRKMQLENQQKVVSFWDKRVDGFRSKRTYELNRQLVKHSKVRAKLIKLERNSLGLIGSLEEADDVQRSLEGQIQEERKMRGEGLMKVYRKCEIGKFR